MLEPPTNMEEIEHVIYSLGRNEPPNEVSRDSLFRSLYVARCQH
jgi:hypothetical protein